MLRPTCALALALFAACGPEEVRIQDGHYLASSSMAATELAGAELDVRTGDKAATLVLEDGTTIGLTLTDPGRDNWRRECPTNYSSVLVQTFDIAPSPLAVAGLSIGSPQLTAGCREDPPEAVIRGTVDGFDRLFAFTLHTIDL